MVQIIHCSRLGAGGKTLERGVSLSSIVDSFESDGSVSWRPINFFRAITTLPRGTRHKHVARVTDSAGCVLRFVVEAAEALRER